MPIRCRTALAFPAASMALMLVVAGCSTLKVKTDYDPNVDFEGAIPAIRHPQVIPHFQAKRLGGGL